ncbi:spike protein [Duck coronavirus DK/GD/27/2014]|uniref:Spike protein n=1 Tax=Duck coronavirus DK/GD/27/2014 TaxID=2849730 RepID=A0A0F6YS09_9GAMC|nr:spike protein [Duck coronavirus]AKF17724.1 spike protein [Duck coronavirus DK/GD/27/2014]
MLATLVLLTTVLCVANPCLTFNGTSHGVHDGNFTARVCDGPAGYYSSSPIRPSDGVYSVNGFYKPVYTCCIRHTYPKNTTQCANKKVSVLYYINDTTEAFSITIPRAVVIKPDTESFILSLGDFLLTAKQLLVYGTIQSLMFLRNGTWYINGVPALPVSYTFNTTLNVTHTSCYESIGAQTFYFTSLILSNGLVEFSAGNLLRSVACEDNTIINSMQCSHQRFNFSTGLHSYDSVVPVSGNVTYIPYPGVGDNSSLELYSLNVSLRSKGNYGVHYNYTCVNASLYTYFRVYCQDEHDWNTEKLCTVSDYYVPGRHLYGSQHQYVGIVPHYTTCSSLGLSLSNINNNLGFDTFCITNARSTYNIAEVTQFQCLFVIDVMVFDATGGSSWGQPIEYFYVGLDFSFGNRMYGVLQIPPQVIYEDQCHSYDIYGIKGTGHIYNVTGYDNYTLSTGGLAISGGNGLLAFRNNGSLYTVKPCSTVSTQAVIVANQLAGLYLPLSCDIVFNLNLGNETTPVDGGCLVFNSTFKNRQSQLYGSECYGVFATIGSSCIYANSSVLNRTLPRAGVDTTVEPLLDVTANVSIPYTLTLAVTTEYLQTSYQKVTIDCARYVCGESLKCRTLLQQYGSFCTSVNNILAGVNDNEDNGMLSFVEAINTGYSLNFSSFNSSNLGGFNLSLVLPNSAKPSGRSFIEDLLFDKVVTVGVGEVDANYDKCMDSRGGKFTNAADLTCAQFYNGIMVLPGVVDPDLMTLYTGSLLGGMSFGGLSSAASIPFATQVQARINYLALTQSVLLDNQNLIANSFNNALEKIQSALDVVSAGFQEVAKGFETVSVALSKVQDVVNSHSEILNKLMAQLNVNFGAISSSLSDIYSQLDELNANAQVDRLITGRLTALSTYAASLQLAAYKAEESRKLALQKVEECVKSQSMRYGFCGNGSHVLTIPQTAPNGMFFIHYTYPPASYITVEAVPGLCVTTRTGSYGVMPKTGSGIIFRANGTFFVTARTLYQPKLLSYSDVVNLTSCEANYYNVSQDETPFQPELPSFDDEFDNIYTELNTSKDLIDSIYKDFNYTIPILNLEDDICRLNSSINALWNYSSIIDEINAALNDTYINLEQLNKVTRYIKWPWYVWLAIGFACLIFVLILCWIFFMTGCCGCCCGCFGIIPLMYKCSKKSSYYTTFDDDVVGEQIRPKKFV